MKGFRTEEKSRSTISEEEHKDLNKQFKSLWRLTVLKKSELFEIESKLVDLHHQLLIQQLPEQRWKDLVDAESPATLGKRLGSIQDDQSYSGRGNLEKDGPDSSDSIDDQKEKTSLRAQTVQKNSLGMASNNKQPSQNRSNAAAKQRRGSGFGPSEGASGPEIECDGSKINAAGNNLLPTASVNGLNQPYQGSIVSAAVNNHSEQLHQNNYPLKQRQGPQRLKNDIAPNGANASAAEQPGHLNMSSADKQLDLIAQHAPDSSPTKERLQEPPKVVDKSNMRFSKEALRVLKEWFLEHIDSPYPT